MFADSAQLGRSHESCFDGRVAWEIYNVPVVCSRVPINRLLMDIVLCRSCATWTRTGRTPRWLPSVVNSEASTSRGLAWSVLYWATGALLGYNVIVLVE